MGAAKYVFTLIVSVLIIMFIIYGIKKASAKYEIPVISKVAAEV